MQKQERVEIICPKCRRTQIITLKKEKLPRCPDCGAQMLICELLDEGKSY